MKQIKVLQVIDNINVDSGVATSVMNIYRHIDLGVIQFDFFVCHDGTNRGSTYADEIGEKGGKVFYFGSPLSLRTLRASVKKAKSFFKENIQEYDVIHLHTPTIAEFTLKYAKRYGAKSTVTHSHSTMTSLNPVKRIINAYLISKIKKYTDHFWACSTEAAEFLFGEDACKEGRVQVIHNAVEHQRFSFDPKKRLEARESLGVGDRTVFVHVSNFSPIKNLRFIVPVIESVLKIRRDVLFLFVGDGVTRKAVESALIGKGLGDACLFAGRTTDVGRFLQAADAFFLPSLKEGFPVAAVEAQANGLKCFLSDTITREVNVGQITYLPLDKNKWVEEFLGVSVSQDSDRLKASCQFMNSELTVEKIAKNVQRLYESVV